MKDTIERQAIINELESWLKVKGYSEGELNIIKAVLYELQSLPSAKPNLQQSCNQLATDLISRQALLAEYDRLHVGEPGRARKMIEDAQSIQPEIIYCKDCKHRYVDGDNVRFNVCELNHNKVQDDDWYCADAERRTDEQIREFRL